MTTETEMAPAIASEPVASEITTDEPNDAVISPDSAPGEEAMDAELRAIYRKHNPVRDETGRFQGADPKADETEVLPDQPLVEEPKQDVAPAIPAPQSWSAEAKAKWATLPPDIQETVAKREREAHEAITRQGQELKTYEPLRSVIEQHADVFERNGVTADDGIGRLLAAERMLATDPMTAIATIAEAYGVDLAQFSQGAQQNGNVSPQETALHRRIAQLEGMVAETTNRISQREQAEATSQQKSALSLLEKFSADKPEWNDLESDFHAELIGLNAAISEGLIQPMSMEEKAAKAYDRALKNNPDVWAKKQEADRKKEEAKRVEEARKRTEASRTTKAVNVVSTTARSSAPQSMDDTLREAYRRSIAKG